MTDYITSTDLKTALSATGTSYLDADISRAITAASRAIDEACGRFFYASTGSTFVYTAPIAPIAPGFYGYQPDTVLEIDDLTTLTSLKVDMDGDGAYETTWTLNTDFYLDPPNNPNVSKPYERVVIRVQSGKVFPTWDNAVQVIGNFGWSAVPTEVTQDCTIYATQLLLRTRQAPFGVLMAGMEIGSVTRISRFDPDFNRLLGHLVKPTQILA